jgi:cysteine desulfurase
MAHKFTGKRMFSADFSDYIYFDCNATCKMDSFLAENRLNLLPFNPSSIHGFGRRAKEIVENARANILNSLGAKNGYNLTFFSSGTEANNTIVNSFNDKLVACSETEHLSVLNPVKSLASHRILKVDEFGLVDFNLLEDLLVRDRPALLSVIYANNETGAINEIKDIAVLCKKYGVLLHTDAVQAYGRIPMDLVDLNADFVTVNCHKIGGPQGVGALISRKNTVFSCMLRGGGQEKGKRPGTENVESIYLFGLLANYIDKKIEDFAKVRLLIDKLKNSISKIAPESLLVDDANNVKFLPNVLLLFMRNVGSDVQLINFDLEKIAVSSGSACSSGKVSVSHVLKAMGLDDQLLNCTIRLSLSPDNNESQVDRFFEVWRNIYNKHNL